MVEKRHFLSINDNPVVLVFDDYLEGETRSVMYVMEVSVLFLMTPTPELSRIADHFLCVDFGPNLKRDIRVFLRVMSHFVTTEQIDLKFAAVMRYMTIYLYDEPRVYASGHVTPKGNVWTVDDMHSN